MYQTYLIVGLIGALMPAKDGKLILGFIPLRIFNALGMACLLCFLYFVGGAQNPDSY